MDNSDNLSTFQVHIARIFFTLKASEGYLVAGGAGLLASELINRSTQDIDLFASTPVTSVVEAKASFLRALNRRNYRVEVIHDNPTFCRLLITDRGDELLVDLAIDSPPHDRPTVTLLGPTQAPRELAARKVLALFGRAEARDFADVYVLAQLFGKDTLLDLAVVLDPGFDRGVLAQMLETLGRLADDEIPLSGAEVSRARDYFAAWANELRRSD